MVAKYNIKRCGELSSSVVFGLVNDSDLIRLSFFQVLLGDFREGEIPDPIPNSEVKPFIADGTAHKSVGE